MVSPTTLDMEKVCRVCMKSDLELFLIFDEKYAVDRINLSEILSECTIYKVQRYDDLPHQICTTCMEWAKNAFNFKRSCEQSYRVLIGMLDEGSYRKTDSPSKIKKETDAYAEKSTQTDDSTMFPCERCEEKFFTFDALRAHRENDHKGSAIVCRFCSKTFNRIGYLRSHIAVFHPESGYTSHNQCNICKRQFTRREHMRRHLALIHKIVEMVDTTDLGEEAEEEDDCLKKETLELMENKEFITNQSDKIIQLDTNEDQNITLAIENSNQTDSDDNRMEDTSFDLKETLSSDEEDEKPLAEFITRSRKNFVEVLIDEDQPVANEINEFVELISSNVKIEIATASPAQLIEAAFTGDNDDAREEIISQDLKITTKCSERKTKEYKCEHCDKIFQSHPALQRHRLRHTDSRKSKIKKTLQCEECNLTFTHITQYKRHNETKHSAKNHQCDICQKNFTTKLYMQRHMASHGKKRFICKECSERFMSREELSAHIKSEGHDKPLLCPECGLRCKTSNILMVHMRRHKGEKPFKCKFCSKGFPRMDDLRIHEKYHTGEKSHFCETCGKGFQRKYNLTIHMRVHTGEKPYKCPHCPHAFTQSNDLKSHIRRHTGERFRCEICGAPFLQGYQMRQHKLAEHGVFENPPTQRVEKYTSPEEQEQQIKQNLQRELAKNMNNATDIESTMEQDLGTIDETEEAISHSEIGFLNI